MASLEKGNNGRAMVERWSSDRGGIVEGERILTDQREIHAKVSGRGIDKVHPAPEDSLVLEGDLGNFQLCSVTITDLKVGPLSEIVADRPMNGGAEIRASRVQAAQTTRPFVSPFRGISRSTKLAGLPGYPKHPVDQRAEILGSIDHESTIERG